MKLHTFLLVSALAFFSCNAQQNGATSVSADEFEKDIKAPDAQILDVRTSYEYNGGHIANTLQANWNDQTQFTDRIQHLDKNRPVYIYCATGVRSAAAARWMRNNGFKNVVELQGGFINWKRSGKPVAMAAPQKQLSLDDYQQMIPATGTALVDFGADWCPPCVKMRPVVDAIGETMPDKVKIVKVDVGVNTDILKPLNINSYPTFIVYKDGKEVWRQSGIIDKAVLESQL